MTDDSTLASLGRAFVPARFRESLRKYMLTAGYHDVPYQLFGIFFFATVAVTYVFYIALFPLLQSILEIPTLFLTTFGFWLASLLILNTLVMFFIWSVLNLKIYARTKEIEEKLPDYLDLVITNLRSGMSFDQSLFTAVRPEFGVLGIEIGMVSKRVLTGTDTQEALRELSQTYDSPILRRSLDLIVSEIDSGGEIAIVIERVMSNLRKTKRLKDEMRASVLSYMMFISIIVIILSPILFGLAGIILETILGFAGSLGGGQSSEGLGSAGDVFQTLQSLGDQQEELVASFARFGYVALATISLFAGMIVSIIEKGDIRGGIKYIPVFVTTTLIIYYLVRVVVTTLFGGIT